MRTPLALLLSLLLLPIYSEAKSVRIVWSPTLRLSAWLDNVVDGRVKSWCDDSVALHIEPQGELKDNALESFLPQVGALLKRQCRPLTTLHWTLIDHSGKALREGSAQAADNWRIPAPPVKPKVELADTTPWQRFNITPHCALRTYWPTGADNDARFALASSSPDCDSEGWVTGDATLHQTNSAPTALWFVHGYPLINLPLGARNAQVIAANNQRLILASDSDARSWLLLPWDKQHLAWRFDGDVLLKADSDKNDDNTRAVQMADALHTWQIGDSASQLHWHAIAELNPQQRDPRSP